MKRIFVAMVLFFLFSQTTFAQNKLNISAEGAILVDLNSDTILYEKNKNLKLPMASTTKIMTALLALEKCKLEDKVIIGSKPPFADGSKIYLLEGEELTIEQLLNALLIESANDAGQAIAEYISGSEEEFAKLMTKRAEELGCRNTNFVNATGLYDLNHYTSAYDLYLITKKAFEFPAFRDIIAKKKYIIPPTNKQPETRYIYNHNKLLNGNKRYHYEWADGVKTGYTIKAKHSFVGSATKNGRTLIAVVLKSDATYYADVINLFNYGYNEFKDYLVIDKNTAATYISINDKRIPLYPQNDIYVNLKNNENLHSIYKKININSNLQEFAKGDILGNIELYKDGTIIKSVPLIAGEGYQSAIYDLKYKGDGKYSKKLSNKIMIPIYFLLGYLTFKKIRAVRRRRLMKKNLLKNK
ncbi:D-alanyl-D-alanine carboxypeptidase DacF precursor [Caloramator mitchellensis]|uniref:serine-type D-Ala-D-Ala carboxypeptidase n=1 Tax=Caloramator mitchellensis TaxID=908809 RepID=A0A0R3JRF0_CALMK|nr:D-alanyl-D-alanine carboxypeptidase family protein [Caloramator mitchellensis]KRQ86008.1 D-alanyl-D-alanine carboxypeptidase DacF precursor [Caloramator mitchellensis]